MNANNWGQASNRYSIHNSFAIIAPLLEKWHWVDTPECQTNALMMKKPRVSRKSSASMKT
eukprot:scaffold6902_cov138-Skeletonema_dohrnii-CCMP3373.AAC.1